MVRKRKADAELSQEAYELLDKLEDSLENVGGYIDELEDITDGDFPHKDVDDLLAKATDLIREFEEDG